jgi:hypothetical protein
LKSDIEELKKTMAEMAAEEECWMCGEKGLHSTYRNATGEYELMCDECHRNEYPVDPKPMLTSAHNYIPNMGRNMV